MSENEFPEKIDLYFNNNYNTKEMSKAKPIYLMNEELKCGVIQYGEKTYLMDYNDRDNILNYKQKFIFVNDIDIYPSFLKNYKRYTYLEFIFGLNDDIEYFKFENGNEYDLRRINVNSYHNYNKIIENEYQVIEYIKGHYKTIGNDANKMKNPLWKIRENDRDYLLMYCETDTICKLCPESYDKILEFEEKIEKKITWYKHSNGYIQATLSKNKQLYIHQVIMNCYGNGKGTAEISIDHIDRNPLNNSLENLRLATRKEQEQNSKGILAGTKKERQKNAQDLPEGITQDMMLKYVSYYSDFADKDKKYSREYFRVEDRNNVWVGCKKNSISIFEKLEKANEMSKYYIENGKFPEKQITKITYLNVNIEKNKLSFEKKLPDNSKQTLKMSLPKTKYDLKEQILIFNEKLIKKYENTENPIALDIENIDEVVEYIMDEVEE
jgi:hypothetical protein